MNWRLWTQYLIPAEEGRDPEFRKELDRLAAVGLRVISGVCVGSPLLVLFLLIWASEIRAYFNVYVAASLIACGLLVLAISFSTRLSPFARSIGIASGYLVFVLQLWRETTPFESIVLVPAVFSGIMLVGIAALPLKPLHTLGLGLAMMVTFPFLVVPSGQPLLSESMGMVEMMVLQTTLICTVLTAVVYHQRVSSYRARRHAQDSFDELRRAQSRLLISENAASQGRFAAAVSHELNSPIGALTSALDTLFSVYEKLERQPEQLPNLQEVVSGATHSAKQSCSRLKTIVERMRHLTNLDRAEEQVTDLNELWTSTTTLLQTELEGKAQIELDLKPLPPLKCRPQQMSAVFSNLIRNSAQSMEHQGTIRVESNRSESEVIFQVKDNGRGIPADRLARLFDPSFRVEGSRVSTTNWGLFISRSIIADHGGRIEIASTEGQGTTATIALPLATA
jgi:signal transduction histidine kinase